jgi:hypothetical protein
MGANSSKKSFKITLDRRVFTPVGKFEVKYDYPQFK